MDTGDTWDRRSGDRRTGGAGPGDRRQADAPVAKYQAFVDATLQRLEQEVAVAAGRLEVEADQIRATVGEEAEGAAVVKGIADRAASEIAGLAEELARQRSVIVGMPAPDEGDAGPSQGAELLVRQMAIAGAGAAEIEARLASHGMQQPRETIDQILRNHPRSH